ncbi:MAG: monovalent cation:proton antiporter-2 (CPA2) family protein, partial [Rickettsiales bacterium]|nr:monovalent cation:proton antiporter-2 (CPA2) family protein [Rickettsiales bacterium]
MTEHVQLFQITIFLCAAVLIVSSCRLLRLSPVIGYLAAGAAIGPFGLRVIDDVKTTAGLAEFGVVFLLFIIGLELSFSRLRSMRKHVFGFGGAQVLITTAVFAALVMGVGGEPAIALIIGGGLALSSTAIVLQVIADQGEKSSQVGRLSLAVLILQDLAVIPLLVIVSLLNSHGADFTSVLIDAAFKAIVGIVVIFTLGYLFLRPFFRFIASLENTELFTATTLLVVLGVASLTSLAGLSPALGAFMAGLLVAETEFKPQVESDVLPFKGVLLGLFFMVVGMSLNIDMLYDRFLNIIGLTICVMATKGLIIMGLCRVFHFSLSTAVHVGLLLSQGGEFAFVLFGLAASQGVLEGPFAQTLMVVVTVSMTITPILAELGQRIATALEKHSISRPESMIEETLDLHHHVIICGFGRVGHTVAQMLEAENMSYVAIDSDSFLTARERKRGMPVYYGDTTRMHVLNALGVARARAVIVTHNDIRVALQTITTIREINRDLPIIARAKNIDQIHKLEAAGANIAVSEMF